MEDNAKRNIEMLKKKKHFNNVDWHELKNEINMKDIRKNLRQYTNLHLVNDEDDVTNNPIEMPPTQLPNHANEQKRTQNSQSNEGSESESQGDQTTDRGRVTKVELVTELRHKYLTILKSIYWEFHEEGQCGADAVEVLMESADRCLDHEHSEMEDWDYI